MNKIMDLRFYLLFITILLTAVSSLYVSKTKIKTKEIPTKLFKFVQEHEIIFQHIQGSNRLRKKLKFQVTQVSKVVTARTHIHIHIKFMFRHTFPSLQLLKTVSLKDRLGCDYVKTMNPVKSSYWCVQFCYRFALSFS